MPFCMSYLLPVLRLCAIVCNCVQLCAVVWSSVPLVGHCRQRRLTRLLMNRDQDLQLMQQHADGGYYLNYLDAMDAVQARHCLCWVRGWGIAYHLWDVCGA